jgi:hypothetical protein
MLRKVDPGLAACEIQGQFQRTDFTTLKWLFFGVIFCDNWSWIFYERKWVFAVLETTSNTLRDLHRYTMNGRISKQLCSSGMPPSGLNENLSTWHDFWNVPDFYF